ncbi:glycosyl transferase group 1 [Thioalkalivibrio nitratireducens DSM 14787]|uniref:Glycosyl transferase group 1 n=1 Tax=Thioalkalivibrio nitratireducens (strain DSM 14787 / UNIQEM 213 / ALEN2) TaxID=1255043 RepID=L0DXT0_THIND|nr:glycosyltransferase family 4 protein [Thioalkalivibrio nitratireducens]AGA33817.1 glycosyl transferase group 1 [Thioalkalivibrio nitratireducens DSM 14787]
MFSQKVLHICLSEGWGGLEMYPARVFPELRRQGWQPRGLALRGSRVASSLEAAGDTPLTVSSRAGALLSLPRLLRCMKREDIRTVHCHKSSDLRVGVLMKSLWPEIGLFFTDHMGATRPKKDLLHRWIYRRLDRLFSISDATRARNLKAFPLPPERIRRLYLGIDPEPYRPRLDPAPRAAMRRSLGIPGGAVAVGLPGRLTPGKGQQLFLEALHRLERDAPELAIHGVIAGGLHADEGSDPEFVQELQRYVRAHGLASRVHFTGFRSDLPRVLEALDIVCVPSLNEAFGLTVIEAMAAARPVIGSNSGAIPEILDTRVGRLADPSDPSAWATAIAELAADPELRSRLGLAARHRACEVFSLRAHVEALTREYAAADVRQTASRARPGS